MYRFLLLLFITTHILNADSLKILIPLYSEPSYWNMKIEILKTVQDKNIKTYAIINPNNGPGKKLSPEYIEGIRLLKDYGIYILGYVHTLYGKRDIHAIKEDIYTWSNYYQEFGVTGIFFDETPTSSDNIALYKDISSYSKSLDFNFIVLNSGYTIDKTFIQSKIADVIVTYENGHKAWKETFPLQSNKSNSHTKLSILLHGVNQDDFKPTIKKIQTQGFDYLYLTEDKLPNPWDELSHGFINAF